MLGQVRPLLPLPDSSRRWTRRGPSLAPRRLFAAACGWASRVEARGQSGAGLRFFGPRVSARRNPVWLSPGPLFSGASA